MPATLTLKREALEEKQYLRRLLDIYVAFQSYVEALKPIVTGGMPNPELLVEAHERFRLKFAEYESLFLEWKEGERGLNTAIAAFLDTPDEFRDDEMNFRLTLLLATQKFQDLFDQRVRALQELHEHIALEDGQSEAEKVTSFPKSALEKVKAADALAEIAYKWYGRAILFAPWAPELIKSLR